MDRLQAHIFIHESQILTQIKDQQASSNQPSSPVSSNGFPVLAIAVLGIMAASFLLISYYIFVTKCCFSWQQLDPLRRFSFRRTRPADQDFLIAYSPSVQRRGLDEMLIREIPTFQYHKTEGEERGSSLFKCVVCLTEFQDQDMLRLLPKCSHAFHLDCIDIWLQTNANCPLCRTSISGTTRTDPLDMIPAPNSSPQDPQPFMPRLMESDEDFVVIEVSPEEGTRTSLLQRQQERSDSSRESVQLSRTQSSRKPELKLAKLKPKKSHHASIMGDECIDVREKDDQFSIQPIRRSISMDSAVDRHVFLSVQEILRQNRNLTEVKNSEDCSSRSQRSIFSFGHGRGSKRAILPVDQL